MSQFAAEAAPNTPVHAHTGGVCPVTGLSGENPHAFCPPQPGDHRAPCPALNSMANHGYLPRDGKDVNASKIIAALMECFKLSKPLALLLTYGALHLLDQGKSNFQLSDLARHNCVEHNASLYHDDAAEREEYAPITINEDLLGLVFADSADRKVMTPEDVAKVRVRREKTSHPPLDFIHAELARGEMGIVLNCFNNPDAKLHEDGVPLQPRGPVSKILRKLTGRKENPATRQLDGVPIARMREWFKYERLPEGWKPYHKTTLWETVVTVSRMRSRMHKLEREQKKQSKAVSAVPKKTAVAIAEPEPSALEVVPEKKMAVEVTDDSGDDSDGEHNTLRMPPLVHSRENTASSATSSVFTDVLRTPEMSVFTLPSMPAPGAKQQQDLVIKVETIPEVPVNEDIIASPLVAAVS